VSDQEFLFALVLSHEVQYGPLLTDVLTTVLGHVGLKPDTVAEVRDAVRGAAAPGAAGAAPCRVSFRAAGGELRVSVSRNGAQEWSISRPLP
jgi:hypothetical protein